MIREATIDDLRAVTAMGLEYYRALQGKRFPAVEEVAHKIKAFSEHAITAPNFRCALAIDGPEVVGACISYIGGGAMIWDPDYTVAHEMCMWVKPNQRGAGLGLALLEDLKSWAADHPSKPHMVMVMSYQHFDPKGMDRLFRRAGFALEQKTYARMVK